MLRSLAVAVVLAASANAQSVSDHLDSLYSPLLDTAYIVGEMKVYLGLISADTTNPQSIMNRRGEFGNDDSYHSIFGEGPYAGMRSEFSPFNWTCKKPPKIMKDSVFVAYQTENERLTPRISTYSLVGWLYDKAGK